MRSFAILMVSGALLFLGACTQPESAQQRRQEADTVAGKMGQAAHRAALAADKAGRVVGRQVSHAAHDAKEGWQQDEHRTKTRN